jgi:type I restriction enzyme M protein
MEELTILLLKKMKENPPYSVDSIISGVCVCFSVYLGIELPPAEIITPEFLKYNAMTAISKRDYPKQLSVAFESLCKFIANDNLLKELRYVINDDVDKQKLKNIIETLVQIELQRLLKRENGTPSQLNKLCMEILKPVNGSFYDGVAGVGSTVISAHLYAKNHNGNLKIFTQEIDILCHALLIIRAFLYDLEVNQIHCGDTLTEPKNILNDKKLKTFDFSVFFPPLGLTYKEINYRLYKDPYNRFFLGFPPTFNADWLFVQHQFSSLNDNGKGIIALPTGALFNAATAKMREEAIRAGIVECIITLPSGMLPYTTIPLNLMVISRTKRINSQILMIQTENLFTDVKNTRFKDASKLTSPIIERICEIYIKGEKEGQTEDGISTLVSVEDFYRNDYVLLPSRYVGNEIIETEYGHFTVKNPNPDSENWIELKRVVSTFYRGINVSSYAKIDKNGEYRIINLVDVKNGELQRNQLLRYNLKKNVNIKKYSIEKGDLLISCKGNAIKICVVLCDTERVLLSINFIGIRVNKAKFNPYFVKYYLESPVGQVFLRNKQVGTTIITLTTRDLENILLPKLSLEEQEQYVNQLRTIEKEIQNERKILYTQSKQAKLNFYHSIGLGKIMKMEEEKNDVD